MSAPLKPTTDLANRIAAAYPHLSVAHRQIADYVLQNPLDTATMTIEGLAQASHSSTATVTRFVRAMHFSGYAEFRASLSAALKLAFAPVAGLTEASAQMGDAFTALVSTLNTQIDNLQRTIDGLDEATFSRVLKLLLKAKRIIIIGSGASHHAAALLEDGLTLYLDANVTFAAVRGGPEHAMRHVMTAGAEDVVIAIAMPRYSRSTINLAALAKKQGTTVLALTDLPSSPLVQHATIALFAPAGSAMMPNSPTAIFALAEALIAAIVKERPQAADNLKNFSENLMWSLHL